MGKTQNNSGEKANIWLILCIIAGGLVLLGISHRKTYQDQKKWKEIGKEAGITIFNRTSIGYKRLLEQVPEGSPRVTNQTITRINPNEWDSGFHAGVLRQLALYFPDWKTIAQKETKSIIVSAGTQKTHDLGFLLLPALRDTQNQEEADALKTGADALRARFDSRKKAIRAWDFQPWNYPVIIDTMPNLELLKTGEDYDGTSIWKDIARTHAETTWKLLVRPDGSTRHLVDLNPDGTKTYEAGQGLSETSTWARGHAWALYGWATLATWTHNKLDLARAEKLAEFSLVKNQTDKIPPWDYQAPDEPKDEAAAAINAAAFAKLGLLTGKTKYWKQSALILAELAAQPWNTETYCGMTTSWIQSRDKTQLGPQGSPIGDYYALETANLMGAIKTPQLETSGIGRIRAQGENYGPGKTLQKEGFFCLTGSTTGLTAAHIVQGSTKITVSLNEITYNVDSWKRIRPLGHNLDIIESDLAEVTLTRATPSNIKRWNCPSGPPTEKNFSILTDQGDHWEWTLMAPRTLDGFLVAAMIPTPLHATLRTLMGKQATQGPLIKLGDSGGPWIQNGNLVAITSRTLSPKGAIVQTAFGSGTWEEKAPPWEKSRKTEPAGLIIALIALFLAKCLANSKK